MKLITSDLDFTLLKDDMSVGQLTKDYLNNLDNNYMFIPCSSRSASDLLNGVKDIDVHYCVCSNGSTIYDNKLKKVIDQQNLSSTYAIEIVELLKDISYATTIVIDDTVYSEHILRDIYEYSQLPEEKIESIFKGRIFKDDIKYLLKEYNCIEKLHLNFFCEEDKNKAMNLIENHCKDRYSLTTSSLLNLEVTNINATKGKAVKRLCNILDIKPECIIGFGDNLNDKSLLEAADIGVAMNNAIKGLKDVATVINKYTNDEEGVVLYLKEINY